MRVLAVDDQPRILDEVSRMLGEEGFEVLTTDEPKKVVELATTHRPDVILLDILMPGMNGYDVIERLREIEETRSIPIVIMTAKAISFKMPAYLLHELAGIINKPFSKFQLVQGLRSGVEKKTRPPDGKPG